MPLNRNITPVMYTDDNGTSPKSLEDVFRFILGLIITIQAVIALGNTLDLLNVPGEASIPLLLINMVGFGAIMMISAFSESVYEDMENIDWNIFNDDESKVVNSKNISFYNGVLVVKYNNPNAGGGFSYGIIGVFHNTSEATVRHEYGHHLQQRMMGLGKYTSTIAIPSLISAATTNDGSHEKQWYEKWATFLGNSGHTLP